MADTQHIFKVSGAPSAPPSGAGHHYIDTSTGNIWFSKGLASTADWLKLPRTKSDVGLGNVDNTSDAAKPISTATQTALNLKADKTRPVRAVTADATLLITDYFVAVDSATNVNLTLPSPVGNDGVEIWIKRRGLGTVTLIGTVDGGSNPVLNGPLGYDSIFLIVQGGLWNIG